MASKSRAVQDKQNEQVQLLSSLASSLLLSDNPREILDIVFEKLSAHLGLEVYFNYLVTEDESRLRLYNYAGVPEHIAHEIEWLDYGQAVCGCVARDKERIVAEDVQGSADPRTSLIKSLGITAYCCHPLIAHDKLIGTLSFGTRNRSRFARDEIELMRIASNLIASTLERKRIEEALRNSEEKYRIVADNAYDWEFWLDPDGKFVYTSPSCERIIGYSARDFMDDPGLLPRTIHPDDRRAFAGHWHKRKPHEYCDVEFRIVAKDGSTKWIHHLCQPVHGEDGHYAGRRGSNRDVTERKRAEESLQLMQHIIDHVQDWASLVAPDGRYRYVNDAHCQALGYTREELLARHIWDVDVDVTEERWPLIWSELKEKGFQKVEDLHRARDGRTFPTEIFVSYLNFHGAEYMCGFVRDITERKRTEEALRGALLEASRFREAMENVSAYVYMKDLQSRYIYANKPTLELFGCSAEELVGSGDDRFFPPETVKRLREVDLRVFAGERTYEEIDVADTGSGRRVYLEVKTPIYEDLDRRTICGLLGISTDITERKRAEEALAGAKEQLASELAAMDRLHAISMQYILNGNLSIVLDNIIDAAIAITNADMGNIQILDRDSGQLKIVAQRGFERPFMHYFDSVAGGIGACGTAMILRERVVVEDVTRDPIFAGTPELDVILAAGVRAVQSTPLLSRNGRLLGMFSTHYRAPRRPDERELKLIDLLARQTADIIERTLAEKQLVDSKAQAELYLDLMGHDINNLHQIALGYLELARDMQPGEQTEFLDKPIEVLQRSAQIISNVRKLQKLHEGVFRTQDVNVARMLSDVQREFGAVPNKQITVNANEHGLCIVKANELLHDVFANLVSNAIKHTGDQTNIAIDIDIVKDDGGRYCRVSVEDDGPGIPDDFKARIFNRTLKGTNKARGMGLGLYLVKSLVDSYGGRVWVEDRVEGDHAKGARFVVMLPAVEK